MKALVFLPAVVLICSLLHASGDAPATLGAPPLPVRGCIKVGADPDAQSLQFSPDGRRLLVVTDQCVRVWDLATFKPVFDPIPKDWHADGARWVAGGQQIFAFETFASGSRRPGVQYFNAESGKPMGPRIESGGDWGYNFPSANGKYLGKGYEAGEGGRDDWHIDIIDTATSRVVLAKQFGWAMEDPKLSDDGSVLFYVSPSSNGAGPVLLRVRDGAELLRREIRWDSGFELSPDGRFAMVCNDQLKIYEVATGKLVLAHPGVAWNSQFSFSPDGNDLNIVDHGVFTRLNLASGKVSKPLFHLSKNEQRVAMSRDGHLMLCRYGCDDPGGSDFEGIMVIHEAGERLWRCPRQAGTTWAELAFSDDGRRVALSYYQINSTYVVELGDLPKHSGGK